MSNDFDLMMTSLPLCSCFDSEPEIEDNKYATPVRRNGSSRFQRLDLSIQYPELTWQRQNKATTLYSTS